MTETEFIALADRMLEQIGDALDAALDASDADVDWSLNDGILEIVGDDGGKIIVNRHVPNREIWVAAKGGGFHFRSDGQRWRDTRGSGELGEEVTRLLDEEMGVAIGPLDLLAGA